MLGFVSLFWVCCIAGTTGVFWLLSPRMRFPFLTVVGVGVLGWWDWRSVLVLALVTLVATLSSNFARRKSIAAGIGIALIALILLTYKLRSGPIGSDDVTQLAIPLGLSYYALRAIHLILESYKGRLGPLNLPETLGYLVFLPTLVVGPIHRFPQFQQDIRRHRWDEALFVEGLDRLLHGFFKVVVIYNIVILYGTAAVMQQIAPEQERLSLYVTMLSIGLGLYIQFSGYSDIAIGFARLLGIKVMENFDYPYTKPNISAFWRSWHISLTSWSREYVYGGVVALTRSPALGAFAALVFVGIWHEASLRYLLWGAYHGLGIVVWQRFQVIKTRLPQVQNTKLISILHLFSIIATLHFVWLGFLLVRQDDPMAMFDTLKTLLFGGS